MPYRRLPNTDNARMRALKSAYNKGKELPPFKLAFSQSTYQRVQSFITTYEKTMLEQKHAYNQQVNKSKEYIAAMKKVKIYISHFIQVMNMAIARGELAPSTRLFFGFDEEDSRLPPLNTESELLEWGENLIKGEVKRAMKGQSPITNPTIAVVKVRYENFLDAYKFQKTLQKNNARALNELSELRTTADDIILNVWNEVEDSFKDLPEHIRREKASGYGVVYVFRRNEINKINYFENSDLKII